MSHSTDLDYWKDRTRRFGETSVGYACDERLIAWDNQLRGQAIARLVTLRPGMRVLDVGTASGHWAIEFAKAGARVTGLDFNGDILAIAERKARAAGVEVSWTLGALEDADLEAGSFDLVTSVTCLQHITEPARQRSAVSCILGALRPDGVFVLIEDTVSEEAGEDAGARAGGEYMRPHSQRGWIELVESQGAHLIDRTGVSFLRFAPRRVPAALCARVDSLLARVPALRAKASVTAFSFGRGDG